MSCRVILYDRKGNEVMFESIASLSREIGVMPSTIRKRIKDHNAIRFGNGYTARVRREA